METRIKVDLDEKCENTYQPQRLENGKWVNVGEITKNKLEAVKRIE